VIVPSCGQGLTQPSVPHHSPKDGISTSKTRESLAALREGGKGRLSRVCRVVIYLKEKLKEGGRIEHQEKRQGGGMKGFMASLRNTNRIKGRVSSAKA